MREGEKEKNTHTKKTNPKQPTSQLLRTSQNRRSLPPLSPPPGTGCLPSCYNKPPAQRLSELKYPVTMATEPCTRGPWTQLPKLAAWQGLSNVSTSLPRTSSLGTPGYTGVPRGLSTPPDRATGLAGKRRQRRVAQTQVVLGASASPSAGPTAKLLPGSRHRTLCPLHPSG